MIPGAANPLLLASAAGAAGYQIERSIRLNAPDSAYLSRTPSVAGNRKTWTWAGWVKFSGTGGIQNVFSNMNAANNSGFYLFRVSTGDLEIREFGITGGLNLRTTAVLRDFSAWYHLVFAYDSTQTTPASRARLYINGIQETAFQTSIYQDLNVDGAWNTTTIAAIGNQGAVNANYLNGYLADVHFIDGQALAPTSFGEFDANGVWQPKAYTGTYPGNSFHLDFADNSAATTAGIGKDVSGNGNDWTPVNLSVAAGAGNDSLVDTPTSYGTGNSGGDVRGNYCTLNPLDKGSLTIANGNLDGTGAAAWSGVRGTIGISSGKWYWEYTSVSRVAAQVGINTAGGALSIYAGYSAQAYVFDTQDGTKWSANAGSAYFGSASSNNAVHGVAFDADNGTITFYRNGTTPGVAYSGIPAGTYFPVVSQYTGSDTGVINFGQRPFAYTAPSGFKALCTTNLPEPQTITTSGSYTGNGVADGPFVYLNGVPTAMTVNGNAVTFGTEADRLSNGFKVRTTSTTYNQNAVVYNYSITSTGDPFNRARAQTNP